MDRPRVLSPGPADPATPPRHSGRAALLAVLAVGFLMIGLTLLAMLQAPGAHSEVVIAGAVLIVGGLALLPIAWRTRHGRS